MYKNKEFVHQVGNENRLSLKQCVCLFNLFINYLLTGTDPVAEITQYQTIGAEIILHDELART